MKLNDLIEAGRNSTVAVSFRAATEMIDLNRSFDDRYGDGMRNSPPQNYEGGLRTSAERRAKASREHSGRITVEIAKAINGGAHSLRTVVDAMNAANVPTRRGGPWSISLLSHELARLDTSVKALRARADRRSGLEPTTWSEKAFWIVVEEQRKVAERHGRWVCASDDPPLRNEPVRHPRHGVGTFQRWDGPRMLCWFRPSTDEPFQKSVKPIEIEVFKWAITSQRREQIFARINKRYLVNTETVETSSLTLEQRKARQRVMRWF